MNVLLVRGSDNLPANDYALKGQCREIFDPLLVNKLYLDPHINIRSCHCHFMIYNIKDVLCALFVKVLFCPQYSSILCSSYHSNSMNRVPACIYCIHAFVTGETMLQI